MVYLMIRHTVASYAAWRPIFDEHSGARAAAGATGVEQVYRDEEDSNTMTLVLEWDTAGNAQKFMNDPALREVMQRAGVIGAPALRAILSRV